MIVGAGKSGICRAGRLEILARVSVVVWSQNSFFRGPQSLYLRPSTERMKPTHMMEGDLNLNYI